jgi:hypothetical protein
MTRPYKLAFDALATAASLVGAGLSFGQNNVGGGVTGLVVALFMLCSILTAIFEDKEHKAWMEKAESDRAEFAAVMATFGYDIHHLKATAKYSPADFGDPLPTFKLTKHACTQTEIEHIPSVKASGAAAYELDASADLAARETVTSDLRRRANARLFKDV